MKNLISIIRGSDLIFISVIRIEMIWPGSSESGRCYVRQAYKIVQSSDPWRAERFPPGFVYGGQLEAVNQIRLQKRVENPDYKSGVFQG